MKVFEILAENKITDIINSVLKGVAWTLGKTPEKEAAAELAAVWGRKMIEAGGDVGMPINVIRDPRLAANPEVIEAARKEAVNIFKAAEREGVVKRLGTVNWTVGIAKFLKGVTWVFIALELNASLQKYSKEFDDLQRRLNSNGPDRITEDQYVSLIGVIRVRMVAECAGALGVVLTGYVGGAVVKNLSGKAIGTVTGFWKKSPKFDRTTAIFDTLNAMGQLYVIKKLAASEDARNWMMDIIFSDEWGMDKIKGLAAANPYDKWTGWIQATYKQASELYSGPSGAQSQSTASTQPRPQSSGKPAAPQPEPTQGIDWSNKD